MLLKYNDEKMTLPREHTAFNMVIEKVNEIISQENMIFSHLIIDGNDIYEDHENYMLDRLNEMMKIEIVAKSANEMIWETMESVHQYVERAIPAIEQLVSDSEEEFTEQSWTGIQQLSEAMEWMLQFVTFTRRADQQPANWDKISVSFERCEQQFAELLQATENKDTALIRHNLTSGIIPTYETLKINLESSLEDKQFSEQKEQ